MTIGDHLDRLVIPASLQDQAAEALSGPNPLRGVAQVLVSGAEKETLSACAAAAMMLRAEAPTDRALWSMTDVLLYSQVPNYHWGMVADAPRNAAYAAAIAASVEPGMTVLEIGAGTGLLAMLAARAGAGHVYTIETNPLMAQVARACILRNDFQDRITVIDGHSTKMSAGKDTPARADLLIHEILAADLVGEGVVPSVMHARSELLVPDAPLLPDRIAAVGALADAPRERFAEDAVVEGFDLSPLGSIDAAIRKIGVGACQRLSDPKALAKFDLRRNLPASGQGVLHVEATAKGRAVGVEQWIAIAFPNGTTLTSDDRASHWSTCLHPLGTTVTVEEGTRVPIEVSYTPTYLSVGLAEPARNAPSP